MTLGSYKDYEHLPGLTEGYDDYYFTLRHMGWKILPNGGVRFGKSRLYIPPHEARPFVYRENISWETHTKSDFVEFLNTQSSHTGRNKTEIIELLFRTYRLGGD